jgi:hypothetical protein
MQTAREFVEEYLGNEARFFDTLKIAFPGSHFEAEPIPEMQQVLDVSEFKQRAYVVVSGISDAYKTRYALRRRSYGWALIAIQPQCPLCHRYGRNKQCELCGGKGWFSQGPRE